MNSTNRFDVVVVGGSFAGLSAALQLARARRRVLVIDAGERRNRFAASAHGFLGHDGMSPESIIGAARAELLKYPGVHWQEGVCAAADKADDAFSIELASKERVEGRRLVLAGGVVDMMPPIEGVAERWGRSVFHCPYCHGYELNKGRIGVLAVHPMAFHQAMMLPDWGLVTLFTNDAVSLDEAQADSLADRGVAIESVPVVAVVELATVQLRDGRRIELDGIFTQCATRMSNSLAEQLGCEIESGPLGPFVRTGDLMETTVEGVFACGDTARGAGNVAIAVGSGALAGAAVHRSLVFGGQA